MPCQFMAWLFQAKGLGSSMGQQGRSGVDLRAASPLKEQRETLARHFQGTGVGLWFGGCTLSSQPSGQEGPELTSQLTGYAVGGLGHGAGPGGRGGPRSSDWKL